MNSGKHSSPKKRSISLAVKSRGILGTGLANPRYYVAPHFSLPYVFKAETVKPFPKTKYYPFRTTTDAPKFFVSNRFPVPHTKAPTRRPAQIPIYTSNSMPTISYRKYTTRFPQSSNPTHSSYPKQDPVVTAPGAKFVPPHVPPSNFRLPTQTQHAPAVAVFVPPQVSPIQIPRYVPPIMASRSSTSVTGTTSHVVERSTFCTTPADTSKRMTTLSTSSTVETLNSRRQTTTPHKSENWGSTQSNRSPTPPATSNPIANAIRSTSRTLTTRGVFHPIITTKLHSTTSSPTIVHRSLPTTNAKSGYQFWKTTTTPELPFKTSTTPTVRWTYRSLGNKNSIQPSIFNPTTQFSPVTVRNNFGRTTPAISSTKKGLVGSQLTNPFYVSRTHRRTTTMSLTTLLCRHKTVSPTSRAAVSRLSPFPSFSIQDDTDPIEKLDSKVVTRQSSTQHNSITTKYTSVVDTSQSYQSRNHFATRGSSKTFETSTANALATTTPTIRSPNGTPQFVHAYVTPNIRKKITSTKSHYSSRVPEIEESARIPAIAFPSSVPTGDEFVTEVTKLNHNSSPEATDRNLVTSPSYTWISEASQPQTKVGVVSISQPTKVSTYMKTKETIVNKKEYIDDSSKHSPIVTTSTVKTSQIPPVYTEPSSIYESQMTPQTSLPSTRIPRTTQENDSVTPVPTTANHIKSEHPIDSLNHPAETLQWIPLQWPYFIPTHTDNVSQDNELEYQPIDTATKVSTATSTAGQLTTNSETLKWMPVPESKFISVQTSTDTDEVTRGDDVEDQPIVDNIHVTPGIESVSIQISTRSGTSQKTHPPWPESYSAQTPTEPDEVSRDINLEYHRIVSTQSMPSPESVASSTDSETFRSIPESSPGYIAAQTPIHTEPGEVSRAIDAGYQLVDTTTEVSVMWPMSQSNQIPTASDDKVRPSSHYSGYLSTDGTTGITVPWPGLDYTQNHTNSEDYNTIRPDKLMEFYPTGTTTGVAGIESDVTQIAENYTDTARSTSKSSSRVHQIDPGASARSDKDKQISEDLPSGTSTSQTIERASLPNEITLPSNVSSQPRRRSTTQNAVADGSGISTTSMTTIITTLAARRGFDIEIPSRTVINASRSTSFVEVPIVTVPIDNGFTTLCEPHNMTVLVNKSIIEKYEKEYGPLQFNGGCRGVEHEDYYRYSISPIKGCGTQIITNETHVNFTNTLSNRESHNEWYLSKMNRSAGLVIGDPDEEPHPLVHLHIHCTFPMDLGVSAGYLPDLRSTSITFNVSGVGKFAAIMQLYRDDKYQFPYYSVPSLPVNGLMRVGITLLKTRDEGLTIATRKCWATPNEDPEYRISYPLIDEFCVIKGALGGKLRVVENAQSIRSRFEGPVFKFIGHAAVWLHCEIRVCFGDSCDTDCTDDRPKFRRKRDTSSVRSGPIVSAGPIHRQAPAKEDASEDLSDIKISDIVSKDTLIIVVAAALITIVMLLSIIIVIAYLKCRRTSSDKEAITKSSFDSSSLDGPYNAFENSCMTEREVTTMRSAL